MSIKQFHEWEKTLLKKSKFPIKRFILGVKGKTSYIGALLFLNNEALPIEEERYKKIKNFLEEVDK